MKEIYVVGNKDRERESAQNNGEGRSQDSISAVD